MARILITGFCSYPAPDRPGVQLQHVIEGLQRQEQVDVLSIRREDQAHVERLRRCRILRVPMPEGALSARIEIFRRALRRQLEGADYDVVHFRDGWSGVTALEMQAQHGFATVFDLTRSPMAEPILTDLATATELERAELSCVRRANLVLAPSHGAARYLEGLTEAAKIHVVPPGVNVDEMDWEHDIPTGAPLVLYLGTLTAGRGVRVLLRAMFDVAAASKAVLVLAGPSSAAFRESLQRAVVDLKLEGRVRLLGEVPHEMAAAVISRATVCVAPGAAELDPKATALYPTKILEYMACRRAVVAPRRGTVEMLMRDEVHGLLFQPGSPEDLADKILALLHGPALRDKLARAGYQLVRQGYTASGTRRRLRQAYGWLAQQESFEERFARSREDDWVTSSITDLGVDVSVRSSSESEEPTQYEGDTLLLGQEAVSASDAGDVTRVEVNPLRGSSLVSQGDAHKTDPVSIAPLEREEGTDQWEPPGADGNLADAAGQRQASPRTVITAPMDASLVAGELRARTPRPELVRPLNQSASPAPAKVSRGSVIPPAPLPRLRRVAVQREGADDAKTRIVSTPLAMIEDPVESAEEGGKTNIVHKDQIEKSYRAERPRPTPRAPKLPEAGAEAKEGKSSSDQAPADPSK